MTFDGIHRYVDHVNKNANDPGFNAIPNLRLRELPAKYGRQFSDGEIKKTAVRLFGDEAAGWSRAARVQKLEEFDEQVKGKLL